MIKSVFGKYLIAFYAIILVCFTMLFLIVTGITVNYAAEAKQRNVRQIAVSVSDYLAEECDDVGGISALEKEDMLRVLDLAMASSDSIEILVTDAEGNLIVAGGAGEIGISETMKLPDNVTARLENGEEIKKLEDFDGVLGSSRMAYALPMRGGNGTTDGAVIVCSSSTRLAELVNVMTKTIVIASLWIMLAVLIAVYFISERVTAPLRDMSRAAKDFAAGRFDRRVTVHGNDEIAELAIAFNQMAKSLENLEKMRSSFMANVSHDLRTPMTTIAGFIDGIRDGVIPPDKQEYYLGIVSSEVHRLSRLVTSLLDLSRIQAGDRKFVMKPFDICEMGRQILISFEQQIEQKRLNVEFVCDEENMFVLADHDAIYQIFYNICDNAVKFSVEGGLYRISVSRLDGKENKNKIRISVYNQGEGIPAEDQPFVFDRFYKADKSRGLDKKGVGLGLYIAKTIISAHGEDIWVTSEEGKDCQFSFTLTETSQHSRDE